MGRKKCQIWHDRDLLDPEISGGGDTYTQMSMSRSIIDIVASTAADCIVIAVFD